MLFNLHILFCKLSDDEALSYFCTIFLSLQLLANQWNRDWGDVSL
jgi:hypothetical protein